MRQSSNIDLAELYNKYGMGIELLKLYVLVSFLEGNYTICLRDI